ncbi:MAG: hypothetical protein AB7F22_31605 [Reyranella sp.]|uniref:hypothetical protein n=1 Tax=Reyranella sp. TaxID=1929291 RepID=UPI003D0AE2A0
MPREIRIFLSTPSDIVEERRELASLIAEINDVVVFLAPERDFRLKLLHYETDAYPDVGGPQTVIDGQIPLNYDIYFGIMWRRAGTPTKDADSGTIHEFERAFEQRKKGGRPTIMFYFCQEQIPLPSTQEELDQLAKVVKFRERFQTIGLGVVYPKRADFRERARGGLLRAVADILKNAPDQPAPLTFVAELERVPEALDVLSNRYDEVRRQLPSGPERNARMRAIVDEMKLLAPTSRGAVPELKASRSAGRRLAAIAILQAFPSAGELAWLADRLNPEVERPFIGFQASVALLQAIRSLPKSDCPKLQQEVVRALQLARLNPDDPPRIRSLEYALEELGRKCN